MYIVRNYTALMYLDPTDKITAISSPVPFDNPHSILGRIEWNNRTLNNLRNTCTGFHWSMKSNYPPDTNPHNNKYTYIPIGASIHTTQRIRDFEN